MKRKPAKQAAPRPKARTRDDAPAHGLRVAHGVEYAAPAGHGVELPDDFPASSFAAEVQGMLDGYGLPAASVEVRRLVAYAVRLRQAWQAAELRCVERHAPARRAGSPERAASFAYQQAMARLVHAARELAALPVRH